MPFCPRPVSPIRSRSTQMAPWLQVIVRLAVCVLSGIVVVVLLLLIIGIWTAVTLGCAAATYLLIFTT